jgi:hypothetical protein
MTEHDTSLQIRAPSSRTSRIYARRWLRGRIQSHHVLNALSRIDTNTLLGQKVYQQRRGNAVTLGLTAQLGLFVLLDVVQIHVEQVRRVQGTALGFGMELCGEDWTSFVDQAC